MYRIEQKFFGRFYVRSLFRRNSLLIDSLFIYLLIYSFFSFRLSNWERVLELVVLQYQEMIYASKELREKRKALGNGAIDYYIIC